MKVFVSFDGDHIGRMVGRASLADKPEEVARISQAIDRGNGIWRSWVESHGGKVINIGGDEGRLEVEADHLEELPKIRAQYEGAVGSSVSVGVGTRLSEADKSLMAAKLQGGNRIQLYSQEVNELLEQLQEKPEGEKLYDEYLNPDSAGLQKALGGPKKVVGPVAPGHFSVPAALNRSPSAPMMTGDGKQPPHESNLVIADQIQSEGGVPAPPPVQNRPVHTVTLAGPEAEDGHAPYTYVLHADSPHQAIKSAMLHHQQTMGTGDYPLMVVNGLTHPGMPPTGEYNDLRDYVGEDRLPINKAQPGMNAGVGAGFSGASQSHPAAPAAPREASEHSEAETARTTLGIEPGQPQDFEQLFHQAAAQAQPEEKGQVPTGLQDDVRAQVVKILQDVRAKAPQLEQMKTQNPDMYNSVKGLVQAMIALAQGQDQGAGQLQKAMGKVGQCKWKLGERRCQRQVTGNYCHDHKDHWANKVKQDPEELDKASLEAGKTGRHQVVLPVGAQVDPGPSANHEGGEIKVRDPETQKTKWRSVRSGLVMAPDGTPTSSRNPSG